MVLCVMSCVTTEDHSSVKNDKHLTEERRNRRYFPDLSLPYAEALTSADVFALRCFSAL